MDLEQFVKEKKNFFGTYFTLGSIESSFLRFLLLVETNCSHEI